MDSSGRSNRPVSSWILDHCYSNLYNDQTGAEYWTHYSGLSGGHGHGVDSTGVTSIAYPGTSVYGPSFHTPSYQKIYEEGSSFHSHQQGSAYAVPPQVLSCDYTSQVPGTVGDKVLCDSEGNQDTGAYPASAPPEQWDAQVSWRYTFRLTRSIKLFLILIFTIQAVLRPTFYPTSYMQLPCVTPSPLKNKIVITSASPESSIVRGNVNRDTGWNKDMGMYPAHPEQWDAQVA
ncbi:hypothetical protein F5888DRAFT_629050 [Russula emetica]|nr:hypothetical protein F5888DRAFT_629050 [Russula emetica]